MRCEVVAVGSELLLGQIVDTNSSWIGEQLALAGIDSHFQTRVGDNLERIVETLRLALSRSDAVIVCGGLGPTPDDITREAIAAVMGVGFERDPAIVERIRARFAARGREMPPSNERQADVPRGATVIAEMPGTAPGLVCPVGERVVYAVPGVPYEMREMMLGTILPDLRRRAGSAAVIRSRVLRTWGQSESGLAEMLAPRLAALEAAGNPTIAFLASGIEGIKVRITAKAPSDAEAERLLAAEEASVRAIVGDIVFGVDDENMERAVVRLLAAHGLTVATAESLTGGLVAARLTAVPGASRVFRGAVVAYAADVKHGLLGVPEGPVVSVTAAEAMARGVCARLGADAGVATTGVAGPDPLEGKAPGTVCLAVALGGEVHSREVRLPGDRERVRQYCVITVLDLLRRRLLARDGGEAP